MGENVIRAEQRLHNRKPIWKEIVSEKNVGVLCEIKLSSFGGKIKGIGQERMEKTFKLLKKLSS